MDPVTNRTVTKYDYGNWTAWTPYNSALENDNTELDLWNCVNIGYSLTNSCSMNGGDVSQPMIKIRGNRCYLCKYELEKNTLAHAQMRELGMTNTTDLFEMAGCLLRLAMWPTEKMWNYVDEKMSEYSTVLGKGEGDNSSTASSNIHVETITSNVTSNGTGYWGKQVGVHFRCGDTSYTQGAKADLSCQHDPNHTHKESDYMVYGTPIDVGTCAKEVINNMTMPHMKKQRGRRHLAVRGGERNLNEGPLFPDVLLFVASDNHGSATQMDEVIDFKDSIISPHGCHIEMDSSIDCSELTLGNWLVLSLSDVIISQSIPLNGIPERGLASAFSRYALIYGLKPDAWRDSQNCDSERDRVPASRKMQGNWFCG
eukprot:CAMPEP_0119055450 /NCGR_PEP_ID=MMETSP1177-20130426/75722_1 /TAXON_ID=2985 /ORGANISM="Ochromonas sp, Strain CCMP1899" /LENGTH=369 /DNA_ID=CAMNT_0007035977 /DNA_START=462 /DNA_END=1571 /DNA_ORIENTATION=+